MKYLLIGADGFIGRHIAVHLRSYGAEVLCCARNTAALERMEFQTLRVDLLEGHAATTTFWEPHLSAGITIIYAAGLLTGGAHQMTRIHSEVPNALANAALNNCAKLILISAAGVDADTHYARSKRAGEAALQSSGLPYVILRPSLVIGETTYGGSSLLRGLSTLPFLTPVIGSGAQEFDPIHAQDLAETVRICANDAQLNGHILSPCGPERLTQTEILQKLRAWMGRAPVRTLSIPLPIARALGQIGDLLKLGPISKTSVDQLEHGVAADFKAFRNLTKQTPRGFSQVLADRPAGTQDLWHARLYLLRPVIRLGLAFMWLFSAWLGLTSAPDDFLPDLAHSGLSDLAATFLARAFGVIDLLIAFALLAAWRLKALAWLQCAIVLGYTISLTYLAPHLWADPYGGLLKNIPILLLLLTHRVLEEER